MNKFAEKVIDKVLRQIREQRIDSFMLNLEIRISYDKEEFQKIKENISSIKECGKVQHIKICKLDLISDGSGVVYFKHICE